jgi:hypothetical protein
MKQKLVTIYLDNMAYAQGKVLMSSFSDRHGLVEEHLQAYMDDGWRIGSIAGFGGSADSIAARGWFAVVLEK